jgi:DegV family protein with EDD domain
MSDSKYVIFTDSCADLMTDMVAECDIHEVPLSFTIDGKTYMNYFDEREMSCHDFFEQMRQGKIIKTAQASPGQFLEAVDPFMKDGYDVLMISFSSALSGTYNSACIARDYLKDTYPDRKMYVIDSLAASGGQGFICFQAGLNRKAGMSLEDNKVWVETHMFHMAHWFTVDDLDTLKRGGRLSATKAFLGNLFKLKPVLHTDNNGKLVPVSTVRGRKQSLMELYNHFKDTAIEPEKNIVMIIHGDDIVTAKWLGDKVQADFHVPKIYYLDLGPVIGAHAGPNTISIFFWATER